MKLLILLILVSCQSVPTSIETNQCSPIHRYVKDSDNVEWINVSKSYCLCRKYRFSVESVGPIGGSWRLPLKECDKVIGWAPSEYVTVREYWESVREEVERSINNGR